MTTKVNFEEINNKKIINTNEFIDKLNYYVIKMIFNNDKNILLNIQNKIINHFEDLLNIDKYTDDIYDKLEIIYYNVIIRFLENEINDIYYNLILLFKLITKNIYVLNNKLKINYDERLQFYKKYWLLYFNKIIYMYNEYNPNIYEMKFLYSNFTKDINESVKNKLNSKINCFDNACNVFKNSAYNILQDDLSKKKSNEIIDNLLNNSNNNLFSNKKTDKYIKNSQLNKSHDDLSNESYQLNKIEKNFFLLLFNSYLSEYIL